MRPSRLVAGFLALGLMAAPALADNTAMMSRQADHIIQINNDLLKQLSGVPSNSHVSLSADVVQRNGKTELRIGTVDVGPAPGKGATAAGAKDAPIPEGNVYKSETVQFGPVLPPQATGKSDKKKAEAKREVAPEELPEAEPVPTPGSLATATPPRGCAFCRRKNWRSSAGRGARSPPVPPWCIGKNSRPRLPPGG